MEQQPKIYLSYAAFDGNHQDDGERLKHLRERLHTELQACTGRKVPIFQPHEDVQWGQIRQQHIFATLKQVYVFIPIITPNYFTDTDCIEELTCFLEREQELGRNDLVLPIYYRSIEHFSRTDHDHLIKAIHERKEFDGTKLRTNGLDDPEVRNQIEQMAQHISNVLHRPLENPAKAVDTLRQRHKQLIKEIHNLWQLELDIDNYETYPELYRQMMKQLRQDNDPEIVSHIEHVLADVLSTQHQTQSHMDEQGVLSAVEQQLNNHLSDVSGKDTIIKPTYSDEKKGILRQYLTLVYNETVNLPTDWAPSDLHYKCQETLRDLKDLPAASIFISPFVIDKDGTTHSISDIILSERLFVVCGGTGSGKTMLLRYLAYLLARVHLNTLQGTVSFVPTPWFDLLKHKQPLPVLLSFNWIAQELEHSASETIDETIMFRDVLKSYLEKKYRQGVFHIIDELQDETTYLLLLLDGLDNVKDDLRQKVIRVIKGFTSVRKNCCVIVTSRSGVHPNSPTRNHELDWPYYTLQPWDADQMKVFVCKWRNLTIQSYVDSRTERNGLDKRTRTLHNALVDPKSFTQQNLHSLGNIPLMMTLIALLHINNKEELPEKRVSVYDKYLQVLLGRWESARVDSKYGSLSQFLISLDDNDSDGTSVRKETREIFVWPMLQCIAYQVLKNVHDGQSGYIHYHELIGRVAEYLDASKCIKNPYLAAVRFLEYAESCAGLLYRRQTKDDEWVVQFANETIQHYLAGRELVSQKQESRSIDLILEHRTKSHWQQAILLGIEHAVQSTQSIPYRLLYKLLELPQRSREDLMLAAHIFVRLDIGHSLSGQRDQEMQGMQEQLVNELEVHSVNGEGDLEYRGVLCKLKAKHL
jgi:hypothetical protein